MNDLKRSKSENKLILTIILNLTISIFEIIGGLISGSLSLISDALHNLSDSASMFISLFLFGLPIGKVFKEYLWI